MMEETGLMQESGDEALAKAQDDFCEMTNQLGGVTLAQLHSCRRRAAIQFSQALRAKQRPTSRRTAR
jgi:hypothetical protein